MSALETFFKTNLDKRIFVVYKNSSVGDLRDIHYMCMANEKILTIITPRLNKYTEDVAFILRTDPKSRIYEVTTMAMKCVLKKRSEEYVEQVGGSILIPDELVG